jgi:hypothetical protein
LTCKKLCTLLNIAFVNASCFETNMFER